MAFDAPLASEMEADSTGSSPDPRTLLADVWGFQDFRPGQAAIIEAILAGENVLAIMPTGAGKSLCYQLPALASPGVTVVVSPLIALMRDQVAQLTALGIEAGALNSSIDMEEYRRIMGGLRQGTLKLLYVAPERLTRPETITLLRESNITTLAIDEAHCVSQWGHDFRPEYMEIGRVREELGGVRTVAFTATADAATRDDIARRLFTEEPRMFLGGFDRPNLRLAMRPKGDTKRRILEFVAAHKGENGVIYCSSRARTEELAEALNEAGHRALPYHAGLEKGVRDANQDAFLAEDGLVVVATIAFGMGIDKPDVRFVCHWDMPKNIESYYQEIGRAGRDGLPADTLTFYGMDDVRLHSQRIEESASSDEQKRVENQKLTALLALCEAPRCRRQSLLAYFGEKAEPCGNCDLCLNGVETYDATIDAQKAMSAMARTGQRFATEHLINILVGTDTDAIRQWGHDRLPTFGVGKDRPRTVWRGIFRQLYGAGLISMDIANHGRWLITDAGKEVLGGRETIALRADVLETGRGKRERDRGERSRAAPALDLAEGDRALFDVLRGKRQELAKEAGVPAYVVFADRTLVELASHRPRTRDAMRAIHGVGQTKMARYGDAFLKVIEDAGL
ncbi:DNA helicase RecQ [Rhodospirillum sp. A1_3_36]|uniref:DNA helicase RecQ n=1 Tax=Rhodospirillum sp. A1_3_36 TaxID=3391666 RepID=UPI0039A40029